VIYSWLKLNEALRQHMTVTRERQRARAPRQGPGPRFEEVFGPIGSDLRENVGSPDASISSSQSTALRRRNASLVASEEALQCKLSTTKAVVRLQRTANSKLKAENGDLRQELADALEDIEVRGIVMEEFKARLEGLAEGLVDVMKAFGMGMYVPRGLVADMRDFEV
jgi:hypothetical protein